MKTKLISKLNVFLRILPNSESQHLSTPPNTYKHLPTRVVTGSGNILAVLVDGEGVEFTPSTLVMTPFLLLKIFQSRKMSLPYKLE